MLKGMGRIFAGVNILDEIVGYIFRLSYAN